MEIKVTILGTSGSSPTKTRSMPGVALSYEGALLLFDCGEGTQMQLIKYGISFAKINAIFISHAHGDHIIGLAGLVRTLAMNRRQAPLDIFVPKGYEKVVNTLISFDKALMTYKINVRGIGTGTVYRGKGFSVSAFALNHTIKTCGYVFAENERRRFFEEKCKKLDIKGEMHRELLEKGRIRIGKRTIKLGSVTRTQPGKKVVYAGDTAPSRSAVTASKGAELLIHESSYAESERSLAKERKHSVAKDVAVLAKEAKVKKLVLTHISARYSTPDAIEKEAKKVFKNSEVAEDGEVIII